jgi:hypothetical protein
MKTKKIYQKGVTDITATFVTANRLGDRLADGNTFRGMVDKPHKSPNDYNRRTMKSALKSELKNND